MDQAAASAAPATQAAPGNLRANALGLPSVLFCIVTGAAPLAAMIFNVPVAVLGGGYAAPAAFLIATIALTIFSVGYIEMSRRVTSAGGFYAFITRGLGLDHGPRVGRVHRHLLPHLHLRGARDHELLRGDEHRGLDGHRPAGLGLHGHRPGDHGLAGVLPHRADREDPRRRARLRGPRAARAVGGHHRPRRRARRLRGRAAEPVRHLRQQRGDRRLRRRRARHRDVRRVLVVRRLRDGAELRRGDPRSARCSARATFATVIASALFYTFVSYMFVTGWGLDGAAAACRASSRARSRRPGTR